MDIRNRIVSYWATPAEIEQHAHDVSKLLLNLLLFDTFVIKSNQYLEIGRLIELFDYQGLLALLKSCAVEFDPTRTFAVGVDPHVVGLQPHEQNASMLFSEDNKPTLRPLSYQITVVRIGDDTNTANELEAALVGIGGLSNNRFDRLAQALQRATVSRADDICYPATNQTHLELDRATFELHDAVSHLLEDRHGAHPDPGLIRLKVHREDETRITVESNLVRELGLEVQAAHVVVGNALLSLARCNMTLAHMQVHSAVTGMLPDERRFMDRKVNFLTELAVPDAVIGAYSEIMEVAGLPTISMGVESYAIDMDRFLKVRASQECKDFRRWLRDASPSEAVEAAKGLNSLWMKAIGTIRSTQARVLRYSAWAGVGVVHPPAGVILGAIDAFFVEKLLPTPGPSIFLSKDYRSMFLEDRLP